jgi:PKD repeat protein
MDANQQEVVEEATVTVEFGIMEEFPPLVGLEGEAVEFAFPVVDESLTYNWDFGDGEIGEGATPSHTYMESGDYDLTLAISNSQGEEVQKAATVVVENQAPEITEVNFPEEVVANDMTVNMDESVSFSALAVDVGLEDELTYSWDFGDFDDADQPIIMVGESVSYVFNKKGGRLVRLLVTDDDGGEAVETFVVKVAEKVNVQIEEIASSADEAGGREGEAVTFDVVVTGAEDGEGKPLRLFYDWDFGDGESLGDVNLSKTEHVYANDGSYEVELTLLDPDDIKIGSQLKVVEVNNLPPEVLTGSPYEVKEGESVVLDASASTDPGPEDELDYAWDLNGDGEFDDGKGPKVDFQLHFKLAHL